MDLLLDGSKPSPEPMLTYHQSISQEIAVIHKNSLKITDLKFHSNLPGANELTDALQSQKYAERRK